MPIRPLSSFEQFAAINVTSDPGFDPVPKPIPNCMMVRLNYTGDGSRIFHNVLHVRYPGTYPGSVATANSFMSQIGALFTSSALAVQMSNTTSLTGVSLRDLNVLNGPQVDSTSAAVPGTAATQAMPLEMAAVLTLRTQVSGQQGRGRVYLGGFVNSGVVAGNVISPALMAALTAFANGLINALNVNGTIMCLALPSRIAYQGVKVMHPARAARTQDVTSVVVRDNHWDTQRRRGLR